MTTTPTMGEREAAVNEAVALLHTAGYHDAADNLRAIALLKFPPVVPAFTTGHCENKRRPGGCPFNNVNCGYPGCDQRPIEPPPAATCALCGDQMTEAFGPVLVPPSMVQQGEACPNEVCDCERDHPRARRTPDVSADTPSPASPEVGSDAVGALVGKWRAGTEDREKHAGYIRGSLYTFARCADELEEALSSQPVVDEAMHFLLTRIGSWTSARWDQHLRHEFGDERAEQMIAALTAAMHSEPRHDR